MVYVVGSNQSLYAVRDLIDPIANINFFIGLGDSGINYDDDDELAGIIKADNYAKTQQKVAEFAARQEANLESYRQRLQDTQTEFQAAQSRANANRPMDAPSGLFLDRSDHNAVARHNERVQKYNNEIDYHRRLVDQTMRAKERYEDALERFKDKQAECEEQIRQKEEELKPALDRDMVAFLGKLQQLVYDCFHNKALIFESFVLLFMAKKAYTFLYDRIESTNDRNTASNIFRQLNGELETLVEKYSEDLKSGFSEILTYVYECFRENEAIFDAMQAQLEQLPYSECRVNGDSAHTLASLIVNSNFQYKEVIDPRELAHIAAQIHDRREQFEENIIGIDAFAEHMADTFDLIAGVLAESKAKLHLIRQNKEARLGEAFDYSRFVLGIFDEDIQDEYLRQQKELLEAMQLEIETSLGINLTKLIKAILETEMLSISAAQAIDTNEGFAFLEYRQKLQKKRQELIGGLDTLSRCLYDISQQPKEKADEFARRLKILLGISVLPFGNLGTLFPIHQSITQFLPALGSGHPVYAEVRHKTQKKLQGFLIAHVVIGVLAGGCSLASGDDQKPFFISAAGAYSVSAATLFLKKKQLTEL
ncbi:MAG: hypothetical protein MUC48_05125 [Leptolyngbya sp. Prado105]|nr:hypothetical protein [Leptolyngbya sp. Prado105]